VTTRLGRLLLARSHALIAATGLCLVLGACASSAPPAAKRATGPAPSTTQTAAASTAPTAQAARGRLRLIKVGTFSAPTYVTGAPGDAQRLFVVQKAGRIALVLRGHRVSRPFLDISNLVNSSSNEQGLLSMAFAPDYAHSRRFYVDYTDGTGDVRIVQYLRAAHSQNVAEGSSGRIVLTIPHHHAANHNGGQLQFGPDNDLYIGVGDGGMENDPFRLGQNTGVLLGKLLRVSPKAGGGYSIPAGNPFLGRVGKRPEIWAYGLRNPWRFSFDRRTGDLVIGDVGQDQQEEIDFAPRGSGAGANYGWSVWEGDRREHAGRAPGAVFPLLVKLHSQGYCAIIGGYVVRDRSLPSLYGRYVYGDDCKPQLSSVKLTPGHARGDRFTGLSVAELSAFGQDSLGRIYAASLAGPVFRIAASR
jgi:glucose/arabinose dehydrogenase